MRGKAQKGVAGGAAGWRVVVRGEHTRRQSAGSAQVACAPPGGVNACGEAGAPCRQCRRSSGERQVVKEVVKEQESAFERQARGDKE